VASANDISKLPPEFARAERFDGVFFLDLPGPRERETIWQMYVRKLGLDPAQRRPQDREWTGAEIRSCCRLAALLDVPLIEAAMNIVPVAITAGEAVERLRDWAGGRCLSAERPGIYSREGNGMPKSGRSVHRSNPQNN
jgi:SpoVK/Ycf46/Vps4 family AAA+-type ATPase